MTETKTTLELAREKLRAPFPDKCYGKLPRALKKESPKGKCNECGGWHGLPAIHLDYIGHAHVTDRLLAVDPQWNWEPCGWTEDGAPKFVRAGAGNALGLWIKLTVLGVTRLGYGTVEPGAFEAEKQLIGDALRNAAMRFGVGLDLWAKDELESSIEDGIERRPPDRRPAAQPQQEGPAQARPQAPPKTLAEAAARKPAAPAQPKPQPQARVEPTAEEIHASMQGEVDDPSPADVGNSPPGVGEYPARCGQNQYDILLDVYGIPVQEQEFLNWEGWADEPTTTNPKSTGKLSKMTWRDAAEGSDDGMRKSTLEWTINKAIDELQDQGKQPTRYHQRAAVALWHLNQRLLVGTAPGTTAYPSQNQDDETPF